MFVICILKIYIWVLLNADLLKKLLSTRRVAAKECDSHHSAATEPKGTAQGHGTSWNSATESTRSATEARDHRGLFQPMLYFIYHFFSVGLLSGSSSRPSVPKPTEELLPLQVLLLWSSSQGCSAFSTAVTFRHSCFEKLAIFSTSFSRLSMPCVCTQSS